MSNSEYNNLSHYIVILIIRIVENDLLEIYQILKRVESKSGAGYESWRRTQAVQKQKDNKVFFLDNSVVLNAI